MELTFTHNDPKNTGIIGPNASYSVSSSTMGRNTSISRNGAPVAQVECHAWRKDILRMGGQEWPVSDFLTKVGWWAGKRKFSVMVRSTLGSTVARYGR
ncbi:hypothetical protein BKA62DRAFT_483468, partial [Auriculariales sp. MPI-PUGE-AT-0066]